MQQECKSFYRQGTARTTRPFSALDRKIVRAANNDNNNNSNEEEINTTEVNQSASLKPSPYVTIQTHGEWKDF